MRWFLMIAMVLATPVIADELGDLDAGRVIVSGEGQVVAVPDMAIVRMGVTAEALEAAEAMAQVSDAMTRVQGVLEAAGIEPRDIQTTSLQMSPRWDNRPRDSGEAPQITGYFAQNGIAVRVRDLEKLGEVLGAVVSDGANQFQGLSFDVSEPKALLDEARRKAVADARSKAELLAEAAGVELGTLIELRAGGDQAPRPVQGMSDMRAAADSMAVPVAQGEMMLGANVTMIFAIK